MGTWITHEGVLYNLDRYCQICRGGEDEICLFQTTASEHEDRYDVLSFKDKKARDAFETHIYKKLEVLYTKKIK